MDFNSIAELEKYLMGELQKTMESQVVKEVRDTMRESIVAHVYSFPPSSRYTRRKEQGGLLDYKNMPYKVSRGSNSIAINLKNDTRASTMSFKNVANIVETGKGYTWTTSEYYRKEHMGDPVARKFTMPTAIKLQTSKRHVDALKKGLRNKGITVT
ncbi:hypothetical protein QCQ60_005184 [Bacillus cereus]